MPKALEAQRDFSAGEIDVSAKRSDQSAEIAPLLKAGLRQCSNMRIRNSKALCNRPGRRVLQLASNRVDEVTISPGLVFRLNFTPVGGGTFNIFDTNGASVFTQAGLGFTANNIPTLTWAALLNSIYIAGAGFQPLVTTWNGAAWSAVTQFNGLTTAGGQRRRFFYRISPRDWTMFPSAATGNITVQFSNNFLVAGHVGTLMRYIGRQILITSLNSASNANATVIEPLPGSQVLTPASTPLSIFNLGDEIIGSVSGAKGMIVGPLDATHIGVQLLSSQSTSTVTIVQQGESGAAASSQIQGFLATDIVAGPGGSVALSGVSGMGGPNAMTFWDEEVMNALRGWPASVFADQGRLGLCNFPAVPNAIGWSAIGNPTDMYVSGLPSNAMFELAPDKVQVQHVLAGPESSEFVFCDRKVYYIPISVTNPLAPGRVAFNILSSSGAFPVQPRVIDEDIVYVDSQNTVYSITAPGMYYRPYGVRNLTPVSTHLISTPIALAVPTQQGTFAEQYIYVLNADGTVAVGKYETENGQIKGIVGWVPWSGNGVVSWISARDAQVLFTSVYPGANVVEALDDTVYLDAAMLVNAAPTALAPPAGKGPLWWIAGLTVDLMDQSTRMMGTYAIDANGFIVPQNNGGENLAVASLVAGQFYQGLVEPFLPAAPPGPDAHQRMTRRRIARLGAHVSRSTGFAFAKIASRIGAQLPAVGTMTIIRRIPAWNQGDDPTLAPPLRETTHNTRPSGRDFDPRVALVKDTPGPWEILEIGMEAST